MVNRSASETPPRKRKKLNNDGFKISPNFKSPEFRWNAEEIERRRNNRKAITNKLNLTIIGKRLKPKKEKKKKKIKPVLARGYCAHSKKIDLYPKNAIDARGYNCQQQRERLEDHLKK